MDNEFGIRSDTENLVIDYSASVMCAATSFKYSEVNWYRDDVPVDHINSKYTFLHTKLLGVGHILNFFC